MHTPLEDGPISRVQEGMQVVDAAGEKVGRVVAIRMGDPEAATTESDPPPRDLVESAFRAVSADEAEPDVPEPLRSRLRRDGYLKVDGPDLLDTDRYVSSQDVRDVSGDRVQLKVRKNELAREA